MAANAKLVFDMGFGVVGGLGLFLLGMKNMSEGMQAIAGSRLRSMIKAVTDNRFAACGIGTAVTAVIQSSSVTTVMVVGFVSAGLMTLVQAIGVIMGANIGTTATAWIIAGLPIGKYGLPILGVAAFFYLFSKNEKVRFAGMAIMGVGMVFYGLKTMSGGLKPIREMPEFLAWFSKFGTENYFGIIKCVLAGAILTAVVQSSSATIGITMGLAMNGIIEFHTAAALVLGENIGTTITAFLASIGAQTNAKRAAYSHVIFNVLGVIVIVAVFPLYMHFIDGATVSMFGDLDLRDKANELINVKKGIALTHSCFNIANTLIFLPMIGLLAAVVTWLVPETKKEVPHLTFLDVRMLDAGAIGIQESDQEVIKMGEHVDKMFGWLKEVYQADEIDDVKVEKIFHREEILDAVQKEVTEFLGHLLSGNVAAEVVDSARMQLRVADEYESLSDYVSALLKLHIKKIKGEIAFSDEGWNKLMQLHDDVADYVRIVSTGVKEARPEVLTKARVMNDALMHEIRELRAAHLRRIEEGTAKPLASLIYTDMLNCYRRVKDHTLNIAEALAGEK